MEENNKAKKKILPLILVIAAAIIIILLLGYFMMNRNRDRGTQVVPTPTTKVEDDYLTVEQRSFLMETGETQTLTASGNDVKFSSSNEAVATVDASGNITAVAKGTAIITITSGSLTEHCGVLVDATGVLIDVTGSKATQIFSDVQLKEPGAITGFAVDSANDVFYFAQDYGTSSYKLLESDIIVNRVQKNKSGVYVQDSWMRFYESGTGRIALEKNGTDTYLFLESNGTYYGTGNTLSKVKWENEGFCQGEYGTTYELDGIAGSASPTLDTDNNMLLVYDKSSKTYFIYDKEQMEQNGETAYLHSVKLAGEQTPVAGKDDSQGFYNASVKGVALYDGYIYQISGSTSIYISVFDLNGTLQYCHRVSDYSDMSVRTPAGIAIEDGKIYLAVGSNNASYYFANVWLFK